MMLLFAWQAQTKLLELTLRVLEPGINFASKIGSYGASVFGSQIIICSDSLDVEAISESENFKTPSLNYLTCQSVSALKMAWSSVYLVCFES